MTAQSISPDHCPLTKTNISILLILIWRSCWQEEDREIMAKKELITNSTELTPGAEDSCTADVQRSGVGYQNQPDSEAV